MELNLTGDFIDANEAVQRGLASRVVKSSELVEESLKLARKIASFSKPITILAKECVNKSVEAAGLKDGLQFERRVF